VANPAFVDRRQARLKRAASVRVRALDQGDFACPALAPELVRIQAIARNSVKIVNQRFLDCVEFGAPSWLRVLRPGNFSREAVSQIIASEQCVRIRRIGVAMRAAHFRARFLMNDEKKMIETA
jgi:hypothetical protein